VVCDTVALPAGDSLALATYFLFLMLRFLSFASLLAALAAPAHASTGCTLASHYGVGDVFHGRTAADGSRFDAYGLTAAHRSLPFGTTLRVVNPANGQSVRVRISDRGPFIPGRGLDLSYGAFSRIASPSKGVVKVCYSIA
jgi:rare lipoprotein A